MPRAPHLFPPTLEGLFRFCAAVGGVAAISPLNKKIKSFGVELS